MRKLNVLLLIALLSPTAFAKDSKSSNAEVPALVVPFVAHESGTYKFADDKDNGNFSAVGAGLRAGFNSRFASLGAESYVSTPNFSGGKSLSTSVRDQYPLVKDYTVNYGVTAALKLGAIRLLYTYYFDSQLHGRVYSSNTSLPSAHYTYHGSGSRAMFELNVIKGLTLGGGFSSYSFDKYSLSQNINSESEATKVDRPALNLKATSITLSYEIPFGK